MHIDQLTNLTAAPIETPIDAETKAHVLLVDDHDVNRVMLQAMIERLGYRTELAVDGADAVAKIDEAQSENNPIDLVLMDVQMPVMDGYQATRMIRASGLSELNLPIVAITANAYEEDIHCCLASGMQAHMAKPVMMPDLQKLLESWIPESAAGASVSARQLDVPQISEELGNRYRVCRDQTMSSLTSLVRIGTFLDHQLKEVRDHLHKLIGTAAMFDDAALGDQARKLASGIVSWKVSERPQKIRDAVEIMIETAQHGRPV